MTDEDILRKHLALWSGGFVWGDADCFMSVFNYGNEVRPSGGDLGAEWRGTYHDEAGALRVMKAAGGGLAGMTKAMLANGWLGIEEPVRGSPVCATIEGHQIGGIYLGNGFSTFRLADRGRIDMRVKKLIGAFWK